MTGQYAAEEVLATLPVSTSAGRTEDVEAAAGPNSFNQPVRRARCACVLALKPLQHPTGV
jgi:hypothetical protein